MPYLSGNLRFAITTLVFLVLSIFAADPAALKERQNHRAEAGFQKIGKSPVCTLSTVHGKSGIRKDHGFFTPDLLSTVTRAGATKAKLGLGFIDFFDGANSCWLRFHSSLGRAPPSA